MEIDRHWLDDFFPTRYGSHYARYRHVRSPKDVIIRYDVSNISNIDTVDQAGNALSTCVLLCLSTHCALSCAAELTVSVDVLV